MNNIQREGLVYRNAIEQMKKLKSQNKKMHEALKSELRWLVSINDRMEGITEKLFNDRIKKLQSLLKEIS